MLKNASKFIELFTEERGEEKQEAEVLTEDMIIHIFWWFGEDQKEVVLVPPMKQEHPFL